jgi:hypothetical protein
MKGLIQERNSWVEEFKAGERPALLLAYEKIRNSELDRLSTQCEMLAEYALYLEHMISHTNQLTLCSVCNQEVKEPHYSCAKTKDWMYDVYTSWEYVDK